MKRTIRKNSPADVLRNIVIVSVAILFVSAPSAIENIFLGGML